LVSALDVDDAEPAGTRDDVGRHGLPVEADDIRRAGGDRQDPRLIGPAMVQRPGSGECLRGARRVGRARRETGDTAHAWTVVATVAREACDAPSTLRPSRFDGYKARLQIDRVLAA